MKNNIVPMIQKAVKSVSTVIKKNSPQILTGCAIVGTGVTAVLAAKGAIKAKERLDILHKELAEVDECLTKTEIFKEEFKAAAPCFVPAVLTGATSAACAIGSCRISTKRTAALATAYELAQASAIEYERKVIEKIGEKKNNDIYNEIAQDHVNNDALPGNIEKELEQKSPEEVMVQTLFHDSYSGRYFASTVDEVRRAEREMVRRLPSEMWVSLNEFYWEMGLSNTDLGDDVGFNDANGFEITFDAVVAPNGQPCLSIRYLTKPVADYRCI